MIIIMIIVTIYYFLRNYMRQSVLRHPNKNKKNHVFRSLPLFAGLFPALERRRTRRKNGGIHYGDRRGPAFWQL